MHPTQATLADFLFPPRSTWNHVYRLLYSYAVLLSLRISEFPMHIFCPQNTQELPKKHHEAGPPEQLHADALSQIDLRTDARHCEDCKEVRLCRRTTQRAFWKIWVGICAWLGEKCALPPPPTFQNSPPPLCTYLKRIYFIQFLSDSRRFDCSLNYWR